MTEQSLSKLSQALVAASAEMPAVPFDSKNPFIGSDFASLGSVIATVRPILAKHGLAIMQFACSDDQARVGVRTRLLHNSGEYIEDTIYMEVYEDKDSRKSKAQVAGSIITYLRRYAQSALLNLYADEDTDGNVPPTQARAQAGVPTHPVSRPHSTPPPPTKTPRMGVNEQGEAKGSASPSPDLALKCKAKFLQVIAEKQWAFYAWLYAVSEGWIMDNERLEDARPEVFPTTADGFAKVETAIKKMTNDAAARGGFSQEEQEAYDMAHLPEEQKGQPEREWWMDLELHFGTQKGTKLIDLERNKLFGWAKNYQPKPFKGKIGEADAKLRKALDDALSWMEENRNTKPNQEDDNIPF